MDAGPWKSTVNERNEIRIYSDDFDRDVTLQVHGDFASRADRMLYAEWLTDVLNGASAGARGANPNNQTP